MRLKGKALRGGDRCCESTRELRAVVIVVRSSRSARSAGLGVTSERSTRVSDSLYHTTW